MQFLLHISRMFGKRLWNCKPSSSAQHGNVPTNLEVVRAKVDKLQAELTSLSDRHGGFAANLESAKQDISNKTSQVRQED